VMVERTVRGSPRTTTSASAAPAINAGAGLGSVTNVTSKSANSFRIVSKNWLRVASFLP
jgi:hypothetical protein